MPLALQICQRCLREKGIKLAGNPVCPIDGVEITLHGRAADCQVGLHEKATREHSPRGLGDVVERVLEATRIGPVVKRIINAVTGKPCGGCKKRRKAMNRAVPINSSGHRTPK